MSPHSAQRTEVVICAPTGLQVPVSAGKGDSFRLQWMNAGSPPGVATTEPASWTVEPLHDLRPGA